MQKVIIADDRPKWQREEDNFMICYTRCSLFKYCSSRLGANCRHLGGSEIPKVGVSNAKQRKAKKKA